MKRMNDGLATADDDVLVIYDRTAPELYRYASPLTGGDRQRTGLTNSTIGVTVRDGTVTGYATTLSLC